MPKKCIYFITYRNKHPVVCYWQNVKYSWIHFWVFKQRKTKNIKILNDYTMQCQNSVLRFAFRLWTLLEMAVISYLLESVWIFINIDPFPWIIQKRIKNNINDWCFLWSSLIWHPLPKICGKYFLWIKMLLFLSCLSIFLCMLDFW